MSILIVGMGGKCLDIQGGGKTNGTPIILYSCHGGLNQQWEHTTDRILVSSYVPGKCLGVSGSGSNNGDRIIICDIDGNPGQKWTLNADKTLSNDLNPNRCIDVANGIIEDGRPILLWDRHAGINQLWSFAAGSAIPFADGVLVSATPDPLIYLIEGSKRRSFPDAGTLIFLGYTRQQVQNISADLLKNIPLGAPLPVMSDFNPVSMKRIVLTFQTNFEKLNKSVAGKQMLSKVTDFTLKADIINKPGVMPAAEMADAARQTIGFIRLLPEALLSSPESPVVNLKSIVNTAREIEITSSLVSLYLGTKAMIASGSTNQLDIDFIMHTSFSRDIPALAIKDILIKPFSLGGDIKIPISLTDTIKRFESLVRDGMIREWLREGIKCAAKGSMPKILDAGIIIRVDPAWLCTGNMTIVVENFKPQTNLQLCLPIINGESKGQICVNVDGLIIKKVLKASGHTNITLAIPENIFSGEIYFNVPDKSDPACKDFWSVMTKPINQGFSVLGGKPVIRSFTVAQAGYVFPRQFVDLNWNVENADNIRIEILPVPTSPSPDELPPVQISSKQFSGTAHVVINCSRRWQGQYVLYASNACGTVSLPVVLDSGWTDYSIGTGIEDITDSTPGLGMQGFAEDLQKTVDVDADTSLFSRAFIVVKNNNKFEIANRSVLVVVDLWSCLQSVKLEVVKKLTEDKQLKEMYSAENILISGTHTHSGPGGYSHYYLYNMTAGGFDQDNFNIIVTGIVNSIKKAHNNLAPGKIYINKGTIENCGRNRSMAAYLANAEADPANPTDKEMVLLKFVKTGDGRAKPYEIGVLNWYALHPTNRGQSNTTVSGDNKGWASHLFELERNTNYDPKVSETFVAAFANSCAGDVSGNLDENYRSISHDNVQDTIKMKDYGNMQYLKAKELFKSATEEITGEISFQYTHLDMSNIAIENLPGGARTWPAALGISFGAGSTEDGKANIFLKDLGIKIPAPIHEGCTDKDALLSSVLEVAPAIALLLPVLPGAAALVTGLATAVITGVGIPEAAGILVAALKTIPVALALPLLDTLPYLIPIPLVSAIAFAGLKGYLDDPLKNDGIKWDLFPLDPLCTDLKNNKNTIEFILGQAPKPIMFPVGNCKPNPLVPNTVPIQLIKIGQLIIAGVPGEFTTMAGRRLKQSLNRDFGNMSPNIVIANYANAYSGYTTTKEEYDKQHYEGASTLYGPHTLAAYQQEFSKLAVAMVNKITIDPKSPVVVEFFVTVKNRGICSEKIYINNRTNREITFQVFRVSDRFRAESFNQLIKKIPANDNLLVTIPAEPFVVSIDSQPAELSKGGGIITHPKKSP